MSGRSGFGAFQAEAKEFFLDVHEVARNFMGEQDWEWAKKSGVKFTDEMTRGTRKIYNDAKLEDRIKLGIFAATFTLPYAVLRLVSDGILNVTQYAEWRITHKPFPQLHPKNRKTNAYVLGAPISLPFVAGITLFELALRAIGISRYGKTIIHAAAKRSANMSRYTRKLFGSRDVSADHAAILKLPKTGWDIADRFGLITIPGLIAAISLGFAATVTAIGFLGKFLYPPVKFIADHIRRALGFSSFSANVIHLAFGRAKNMSRYTRSLFFVRHSKEEYNKQLNVVSKNLLLKKPSEGWNSRSVMDRVGLVTLTGVISLASIGFGLTITLIGYVGHFARRILGFTAYGANVVSAAGKRAFNITYPYTSKITNKFTQSQILKNQNVVFSLPTHKEFKEDPLALLDRIGLVTLPGAVAAALMITAVGIRIFCSTVDVLRRVLGFSHYGKNIIKAAAIRAANMSQYTKKIFPKSLLNKPVNGEYSAHSDVMKLPKTTWQAIDRLGLVTFPGIIAALSLTFAVSATAVGFVSHQAFRALRVVGRAVFRALSFVGKKLYPAFRFAGDHLRRVLGFSKFGFGVVWLAFKRAANMSRYTRGLFGIENKKKFNEMLDVLQTQIFTPQNGWNSREVADRISLITFPGIVAATGMMLGLLVTAIGYAGQFTRRLLGFTKYGLHVVKAAGKRAVNISQRYTSGVLKPHSQVSILKDQSIVFSLPTRKELKENPLTLLDRAALFTIPGIVALTSVVLASALTVSLGTIETIGRSFGFSKRSFYGMGIITVKCANMVGFSDPKGDKAIETLKAPVRSWWDALDCVGAALSGVIVATVAAPIFFSFGFLGFSKSNYHRLNYRMEQIRNAIRIREGKNVDRKTEEYHAAKLKQCEQTKLGNFFSKVNLLNIVSQALYYATRYIFAPFLYLTIKCIKNLFGFLPLVKTIHKAIHPPKYDLTRPEDIVRKRFADLKYALNKYGELPLSENENFINIEKGLNAAKNRNIFERFGFGLFSESRKIMSLGKSPDERILATFKEKFAEFVRVVKRQETTDKKIPVDFFFTTKLDVKNPDRFSYENIVARIKKSYSDPKIHFEIDKVAALLKKDLTEQIANTPKKVN